MVTTKELTVKILRWVMSEIVHLRRQAELCLRLSQLCSDEPVSRHLSFLAVHDHEVALQAEFGVSADSSAPSCLGDEPTEPRLVWH